MSILSRFFDRPGKGVPEAPLAANPHNENALSLQLLFDEQIPMRREDVIAAFQSFHSSMADARCDPILDVGEESKLSVLVGWGDHVIRLLCFDSPVPSEVVDECVDPSPYAEEVKDRARSHKGHILLYYEGYESSPHECYVALAAAAGALSGPGAIAILNEAAHSSFPAFAVSSPDLDGDIVELLRTFPLAALYCGFVTYEIENTPGVWMRTYGAHFLGLPDLAAFTSDENEVQRYFELFDNIFTYLRESGSSLKAGNTMQVGDDEYLRFRERFDDEYFLESDGDLFVIETIDSSEINQ